MLKLFRASPYRGGESLLLFTPNVKLIFAKIGKKVKKRAKKVQNLGKFGIFEAKTSDKMRKRVQNRSKWNEFEGFAGPDGRLLSAIVRERV